MRVPALSVRAALLFVALVSIVPALAIIVATGFEHARHLEESAVLEAHRSVESIVGVQGQISESMRRMLATIVGMRAFRAGDEREQLEIVTDLLRDNPELVNISVTDRAGFVTVSPGLARGTDLSGRRHIRGAIETGRFFAGEFVTAFVDDVPSLPFAYPIRNSAGEIAGAITSVYPLAAFGEIFDRLNLPETVAKPIWLRIAGIEGSTDLSFLESRQLMDHAFRADERCDGCGVCARICPVRNIELVGDRPVWQHRCEQCFACLQWCPREAIQFRGNTSGQRRYHHPDVTLADMVRAAPGADASDRRNRVICWRQQEQ